MAPGQRRTKCKCVILSQREEEEVTESEKGDEFHPWVSSQQPWVVLMGFLALADTMENKGAQLDPISRLCFPFQFATDLELASMLPQAGKEQGTTSCWITQLRGQENYITRQILYVCTMGSSSRDRKERGDAKAGETLADFHLCLALPHFPPM